MGFWWVKFRSEEKENEEGEEEEEEEGGEEAYAVGAREEVEVSWCVLASISFSVCVRSSLLSITSRQSVFSVRSCACDCCRFCGRALLLILFSLVESSCPSTSSGVRYTSACT